MTTLADLARPYQLRMTNEIHHIHHTVGAAHAYAQAPTGTGKTFLMFLYGETQPGLKIIVAGQSNLIRQHKETLDEMVASGLINPDEWYIDTWQGVVALIKSGKHAALQSAAVLFFDECHIGGSKGAVKRPSQERDQINNKSYRAIIENIAPKKRVNVSATTWDVNEQVLGQRDGHVTIMTYEEGYAEGYLHPVSLNRVDVGTDMTFKIKNIEEATGEDFHVLAEKTPEELYAFLRNEAHRRGERISVKDITGVVEHRLKTMIDLYATNHLGEKAIFYCPNTYYANWAANHFNKRMIRKNGEGAWGDAVHSNIEVNIDPVIDDFKDTDLKRVLFVVGMLNEGFDYPSLALAFDCAFSPANVRRMLQWIGRVIRTVKDGIKPLSQYYYAVDVVHLFSKSGKGLVIRDDFQTPGSLTNLTDDDRAFGMMAFADRVGMVAMADELADTAEQRLAANIPGSEIVVEHTDVENDDGEHDTIRIARTPFFTVELVDGSVNRGRIAYRDLFASVNMSEENKLFVIAMARNNEHRPSQNTKLGACFQNYISPNSKAYDPNFHQLIKDLRPDWFINSAVKMKEYLISRARNGDECPSTYKHSTDHKIGMALRRYVNPNTNVYDLVFDQTIRSLRPDWFDESTASLKKKMLIQMAVNNESQPTRGSHPQLALAFYRFINPASDRYDADFTINIRGLRPDWFENKNDSFEEELVLMAKSKKPRPRQKTEIGAFLTRCTTGKNKNSDFSLKLRELRPDWFIPTSTSNKEKLVGIAKSGVPRPPFSSKMGQALSCYTTKSGCYDEEFYYTLIHLRPDWFKS